MVDRLSPGHLVRPFLVRTLVPSGSGDDGLVVVPVIGAGLPANAHRRAVGGH